MQVVQYPKELQQAVCAFSGVMLPLGNIIPFKVRLTPSLLAFWKALKARFFHQLWGVTGTLQMAV